MQISVDFMYRHKKEWPSNLGLLKMIFCKSCFIFTEILGRILDIFPRWNAEITFISFHPWTVLLFYLSSSFLRLMSSSSSCGKWEPSAFIFWKCSLISSLHRPCFNNPRSKQIRHSTLCSIHATYARKLNNL